MVFDIFPYGLYRSPIGKVITMELVPQIKVVRKCVLIVGTADILSLIVNDLKIAQGFVIEFYCFGKKGNRILSA